MRVAIIPLLQELFNAYKDMASEWKINLALEPYTQNLAVEGDAGKITIVVSNLIKNALTHTNERGHVLVRAEQVPGYVKVSVMDNGIGIPVEEQERIELVGDVWENRTAQEHACAFDDELGLDDSLYFSLLVHTGKLLV